MVRIVIDMANGTIQLGEWVYSLEVLAAGRVRPVGAGAGGEAARAAAGKEPAGEGRL